MANKTYPTLASKADRYKLYLKSVQEPSVEVRFFDRVYRKEFGVLPRVLREDFSGAGAVCYEWVRGRPERLSLAVDLDAEPLAWGARHIAPKYKPGEVGRVKLLRRDVRDVFKPRADVVGAQNFSFYIFKTEPRLLEYFKAAYRNLAGRGVLVLDLMGGSEALEEDRRDDVKHRGFTYIWEHARFNPITHHGLFHIHFAFKDGSEIRKAFTYDWRLWTIPEVRRLLLEAGFDRADVYWEGTHRKYARGTGVYHKRESVPSDPAWVSYVVGVKGASK